MTQTELKQLRWEIAAQEKRYYHSTTIGDAKTLIRAKYNSMAREYNREKKWFNKEIARI